MDRQGNSYAPLNINQSIFTAQTKTCSKNRAVYGVCTLLMSGELSGRFPDTAAKIRD